MKKQFISLIMTSILLMLSLLSFPVLPQRAYASSQQLPVPREQAVIMETDTSYTVLDSCNPFIPMGTQWGSGWHQVANEWDWYINYATGEVIYWRITGWEYKDDYKTFIMHIRKGVTWNDGVPYTAQDVVFTLNMLKEYKELFGHAFVEEWVESVEAPDNYTVVIHLKKPNPRFHHSFRMWGGSQGQIVAKHIWEGKDPTTFKNFPPVETGPYKLYGVYPELNMFVWERREDYWAKDLGYFPAPKYVIWRYAPPPDIDLADFVKGMVDAPLPHLFSWDMIKSAMALTPNVTIAPFLDPCPLGISTFNLEKYPLNIREVRWAIALCLNKEKLSELYPMAERADISPYPWPIPKYGSFDKYVPMAEKALERIKEELGFTYEYNPEKAAKILDDLNFIDRDKDGIRETPNGTKLSFELMSRPQTVVQEYYIAADLAEELKKIGIDASVRTVDPAMWHEFGALGQYDIAIGSLCTGAWLPGDIIYMLDNFHSKWYVPIGTRAIGGGVHGANPRYQNPELDAIVDQLWTIGPDDPKADELYEQGIYIIMKDMLSAPAVEKMFVQTFSTAYWTGWPSEDNMYHVPYIWWPEIIFVLFQIKPVAAPPPVTIEYVGTWFTGAVEAFTGVDGKSYGPFAKGEYAIIPKEDADRFVEQGLASYTAPMATEITEALSQLSTLTDKMSTLSDKIDTMSDQMNSLIGQVGTLTSVAAAEGIGIIILAIALVLAVRKK